MSEAAERWLLEVVGANRPGASLPLSGVLVLGSDPKRAGYVVEGAGVESAHCAIGRTKGGGFAIKDLGSARGTLVNGERVESARLAPGDVLALGTVSLRVVDPGAPARAPVRVARAQPGEGFETAELVATSAPVRERALEDGALVNQPLPAIPGYKIERRVGRGGMGDVYLAVQESLARSVALKVLSPKFEADREFVRRFQAEARAAAALNHPNVVTVYDVGEASGKHYLSMEYMDRGNLEDRLGNGARIDEREVLDILRDATAGLVYAEARGIVHRDIKPANLMQNHVGATKIADLGLATHVESEEAQPADKKVFGTPHFMSPEQVRGERVDSRSDLYSLGATAYRLLTGRTPFEGRDAREIVRAVLRDEPRPIRDVAPEVSAGSAALVERLMRKDAAQRFASAAEALEEIERLRNPSQHSVTIVTDAPRKRGKGVLVLLLLALGGAAWWWTRERPKDTGATTPLVSVRPPPVEPAHVDPTPPEVTPTDETPSEKPRDKDDKDLQLFEAQGKVALLELLGRELPDTQRRDELRALAAQYQGTSAASEALEKADAITSRLLGEEAAQAARKASVDDVLSRMNAAAKLEEVPPSPKRSLLAMRAVEGQAPLREFPEFVAERKTLETKVCRTAILYADAEQAEADRKLNRGDYEGGLQQMRDLQQVFELPEFPMGEAPSGANELFERGRSARERLHTVEAAREVFVRQRDRSDALAVAQGLGGPTGLEADLRRLDFAAAKTRVDAVIPKVGVGPTHAFLTELSADCERARIALETLGRECQSGGWRRKSFTDPRDRKGTARNATGADASGILFDGEHGAADHVPWSAFGGNTRELSKLFFERCTRDWTAEELRGIAALLTLEACVEVIDDTAKMFDATKKSNFTEANRRELTEAFIVIAPWAAKAPEEQAQIARESEAAGVLGTALRKMTDSEWSASVAGIERLIEDYQDSLLVRLLSNGMPATEPR